MATLKLSEEELKGLAEAAIGAILPEGRGAGEVMYGDYSKAHVVYYRRGQSDDICTESVDEAIERLLADSLDDVVEALCEWVEANWGEDNLAEDGQMTNNTD